MVVNEVKVKAGTTMDLPDTPLEIFRITVCLLLWLTLITGLIFPALVTGISQWLFPDQRRGSLIVQNGKVVGSRLIGQPFENPAYFWGRPSATGPSPYNAAASGGSNLGPHNPALQDRVQERILALSREHAGDLRAIPVDLVTASGSGLDPHISIAAALWQVPRVAARRRMAEAELCKIIDQQIEHRLLNVLGEPVVNVLQLNLALDKIAPLSTESGGKSVSHNSVIQVSLSHE